MKKLKKFLLLLIGLSSIIAFAFFSILFTDKPAKILAGQKRLNPSYNYTMYLKVVKEDNVPIININSNVYVYLWTVNHVYNTPFPGVATDVSIIEENDEFVIGTIPVNTAEYDFMILSGQGIDGGDYQTNDIVFSSFESNQNGVFISTYSVQQNLLTATPFSYQSDYSQGYEDGYYAGRNEGIEEGYQQGYVDGEENGFNDGYQMGIEQGLAENDSYGIAPFVQSIFNGFSTMLNVEIFPKIKLWYLIGIPLIFGIVRFIIGWIK